MKNFNNLIENIEQPVLSICVPTFNRSKKLEKQLIFILEETADIKNIEIIVSDNASTDDTKSLLILGNEKIKSHKNIKNLGLVGNLFTLANLACGKYIWFVGDDDDLVKGAIKNIILSLSKESSFLFLNHSIIDGNSGSCLYAEAVKPGPENFYDGKDCVKELPFNLISQLMFITACIYRREFLLETIALNDNLAAPMRYSLYCASRGAAIIIRDQCLVNYWGNTSWEIHASKIRQVFIPKILLKLPKYGYGYLYSCKLLGHWYRKNWREAIAYHFPIIWKSIQFMRRSLIR